MNWQPSASLDNLRFRAQFMAKIRQFFAQRGYLEVETPIMSCYGVTDVHLQSIEARCLGKSAYLHTSPEYAMKRLLAAGSGPIFQIAKVFRDDECGRWHNPEFSLLEWYQLEIDHHALMIEMDIFLQTMLNCPPLAKRTYREVFLEACQLDPFEADLAQLKACVIEQGLGNVFSPDEADRDQFLFLLMSHVVEPKMAPSPHPIAVYDFPASQAALAQVQNGYAERFEIYYRGIELANGFHELTDPILQAQRFDRDRMYRQRLGLSDVAIDPYFIKALAHGLPACSGVALGVDRLLAIALNCAAISEVMAFDFK